MESGSSLTGANLCGKPEPKTLCRARSNQAACTPFARRVQNDSEKNASTSPSDDPSLARAALSPFRSLLRKPAVCAILMTVVDIGRKQPFQVQLVDGAQMVKQFATATSNTQRSATRFLPRATDGRPYSSDFHGANCHGSSDALLGVMIVNDKLVPVQRERRRATAVRTRRSSDGM